MVVGGTGQRVLLVAPQPFYDDRGTPIAVREVLRALNHLGYEVDLLTYPIGRAVDIPGVRVYRSANPFRIRNVPIGFSLRKLLLDLTLVPLLWHRIHSGGYVCVHAVEEAAFPAVFFARRRGLPVIYDMQSSLADQMRKYRGFRSRPAQAALRSCERWLLENASLIMSSTGLAWRVRRAVASASVGEWMFASDVAAAGAADIASLRQSLALPEGARVVMYTGSLAAYQGIDTLLGAMPDVCARFPDVCFVLVGLEDGDRPAITRRAAALGLNGQLRLVERQPRERMPGFLSIADVVVSPRAYGDNLPLKIFDYLAAGRPIVATDIPTHRALLDDRHAVLVPPQPAGLAAGLNRVLADADLAARLADGARDYARANLGWVEFVRSVGTAYGNVVGTVHGNDVPR